MLQHKVEPRALDAQVQGQRGKEEVWPLSKDVKEAINHYLKLDRKRRELVHSDGEDGFLFQPHSNYRTLQFDKGLSSRMVHNIVRR